MEQKISTNTMEHLSEIALKRGSYNFLLAMMGVVMFILLGGLAFIIKQNSDAIQSIPRDLAILIQRLDSMDKKLDMLFMERFEIVPKK